MISIVVVMSYENDNLLGSYFSDCAKYAISFLNALDIMNLGIKALTDTQCNSAYFDMQVIPIIAQQNTMLIVYSHGSDNAFFYQGTPFIQSTINSNNIDNTIIYTNACSTGLIFGKTISASGGVFIGYESDIRISTDEYYRKLFVECDNWGLFCLFHHRLKLAELKQAVKARFNYHIDDLYQRGGKSFVISSYLQEARDNFVVLGKDLDRTII